MNDIYSKKVRPHLKQAELLAFCGKTEEEIAEFFDIKINTLKKYRREHAELDEALSAGKNSSAQVMKAFFKRACGYTAQEETCEFKGKKNSDGVIEDEQVVKKTVKKDVPPDLNAIKWWLDATGAMNSDGSEPTVEEAREMLLEKQRIIEEDK